ncbi:MAG: YciI family protein [Actinomycetota bacterium]|nr:YciI family protein [Actinomycetota bacterium]
MLRYALLLYLSEGEQRDRHLPASCVGFPERSSANVLSHLRLRPAFTATSVRRVGAGVEVADGAVVEAPESLDGLYIIQTCDLDEALAFAREIPAPWSAVEVRPLWTETT